jgi:hypothetical protein
MAIELSNLKFTDQDDIVPQFGVEQILNTGIANTLAGNDIINGTSKITTDSAIQLRLSSIFNSGTLNTADGNDVITGTLTQTRGNLSSPLLLIMAFAT